MKEDGVLITHPIRTYLSVKVRLVEPQEVGRVAQCAQVRQARRGHILLSPDHGDVFATRSGLGDLDVLRDDGRAPIVPDKNQGP